MMIPLKREPECNELDYRFTKMSFELIEKW